MCCGECRPNKRDRSLFLRLLACLATLGAVACLTISFAWTVAARSESRRFLRAFTSLAANWELDTVFQVTDDPGVPLAEGYYLDEVRGRWPGTAAGCHCPSPLGSKTADPDSVRRGACSFNDTRYGCRDVPQTQANGRLRLTLEGKPVFLVRGNRTSLRELYLHMQESGECDAGFRHCGNTASISRGLCVPVSLGACPLTALSLEPQPGFAETSLNGRQLFVSSSPQHNPLTELLLEQSHPCFVRSHFPLSAGRRKYPLFEGEFDACEPDPKPQRLFSIGERDLLLANAVPIDKLPAGDFSNAYLYHFFAGRLVEWSPRCKEQLPKILAKPSELANIDRQYANLLLIYIIAFIPSVCALVCQLALVGGKSGRRGVRWTFAVHVTAWLLAMPPLIICTSLAVRFSQSLSQSAELDCSDDASHQQFERITAALRSKVVRKSVVSLVFAVFGLPLESFGVFLYLRCHSALGSEEEPAASSTKTTPSSYLQKASSFKVTNTEANLNLRSELFPSHSPHIHATSEDPQASKLQPADRESDGSEED